MKKLHIWFIAGSISFFVVSSVAFYREHHREWKDYQRQFRQIEYEKTKADYEAAKKELAKSSDETERKSIKSKLDWYESRLPRIKPGLLDRLANFIFIDFLHPTNKINQVYLPGLNHRVDRCTTCHMAIDRPGFERVDFPGLKRVKRLGFDNQGLPFTTHSHYDLIIKNHPPETFGCTICHQGQGRATEGKAARGDVKHWEESIMPAKYVESSCGKCHLGLGELTGAPRLSRARQLFQENQCYNCHTINREDLREMATGTIGPPLTVVGSKRVDDLNWGTVTNLPKTKWAWHFAHLKNPKLFTPDTQMTNFGFTDEEADDLVNFVLGFVDEKIDNSYLVRLKVEEAKKEEAVVPKVELDAALDEL